MNVSNCKYYTKKLSIKRCTLVAEQITTECLSCRFSKEIDWDINDINDNTVCDSLNVLGHYFTIEKNDKALDELMHEIFTNIVDVGVIRYYNSFYYKENKYFSLHFETTKRGEVNCVLNLNGTISFADKDGVVFFTKNILINYKNEQGVFITTKLSEQLYRKSLTQK